MSKVVTCRLRLGTRKVYYQDTLRNETLDEDLNLDLDDGDILHRDTRNWLARRIEDNRDALTDEEEAKLLGRHLFEVIFRGKIRARFHDLVETAPALGNRVRLELVFGEGAEELARLPWEFLYSQRGTLGDGFLAGEMDRFTVTRFIGPPLQGDAIPEPLDRPVRILLAVCSTGFSAEKSDNPAIRELKRKLDESAADIDLCPLANPTLEQLQDAVAGVVRGPDRPIGETPESWLPDVVHIIGHGNKGSIMLHREERAIMADRSQRRTDGVTEPAPEYAPVQAQSLKEMFTRHPKHRPRLVILQTCWGDKVDGEALYTLAHNIVGAGVPAVLAMQYDIGQKVADKFAGELYEGLLNGEPIDMAVRAGRIRLKDRDVSEASPYRAFGTPVIYLGHDKPLVKKRSKKRPEAVLRIDQGRECPRCHKNGDRDDQGCAQCGLRFYCTNKQCNHPYRDPVNDAFCVKCLTKISQEPYSPGDEKPAVRAEVNVTERFSERPKSPLIRGSAVSLRSQLRDEWTPTPPKQQSGELWPEMQ